MPFGPEDELATIEPGFLPGDSAAARRTVATWTDTDIHDLIAELHRLDSPTADQRCLLHFLESARDERRNRNRGNGPARQD